MGRRRWTGGALLTIALLCAHAGLATPTAAPLSADVNQDGCVNDIDLAEIDAWAHEPAIAQHPVIGRLDVTQDGMIDGRDYDEGLNQYGQCQ